MIPVSWVGADNLSANWQATILLGACAARTLPTIFDGAFWGTTVTWLQIAIVTIVDTKVQPVTTTLETVSWRAIEHGCLVTWETESIKGWSFFNPEVPASWASETIGFILPIASLTAWVALVAGWIILIEVLMPCAIIARVRCLYILRWFIYAQPTLIIPNISLGTDLDTLVIIDSIGTWGTNKASIGRVFTQGTSLVAFLTFLLSKVCIKTWATFTKTSWVAEREGMVVAFNALLEWGSNAMLASKVAFFTI